LFRFSEQPVGPLGRPSGVGELACIVRETNAPRIAFGGEQRCFDGVGGGTCGLDSRACGIARDNRERPGERKPTRRHKPEQYARAMQCARAKHCAGANG
jgi:hypothetical protein